MTLEEKVNYLMQKDIRKEFELLIKEQISIHNQKHGPVFITQELLLHNIMGLIDEYVRRLKESEEK
jgi:hypothetical protein